jgi:hypothetical protein
MKDKPRLGLSVCLAQFIFLGLFWGLKAYFFDHETIGWSIATGVWMGISWVLTFNFVFPWIDRQFGRFGGFVKAKVIKGAE